MRKNVNKFEIDQQSVTEMSETLRIALMTIIALCMSIGIEVMGFREFVHSRFGESVNVIAVAMYLIFFIEYNQKHEDKIFCIMAKKLMVFWNERQTHSAKN